MPNFNYNIILKLLDLIILTLLCLLIQCSNLGITISCFRTSVDPVQRTEIVIASKKKKIVINLFEYVNIANYQLMKNININ